jgi:hypothetical protein
MEEGIEVDRVMPLPYSSMVRKCSWFMDKLAGIIAQ